MSNLDASRAGVLSEAPKSYWCHVCSDQVSVHAAPGSDDLQCDVCSSLFVERLGQGVETFLQAPAAEEEEQEEEGGEDYQEGENNEEESAHEEEDATADLEEQRMQALEQSFTDILNGRGPRVRPGGASPAVMSLLNTPPAASRPQPTELNHDLWNAPSGQQVAMSASADAALSGELLSGMIQRIIGASLPQLVHDPSMLASGRPLGVVVRTNVSPSLSGIGGQALIGEDNDLIFENFLHHILMNESSYRSHGADPEEVKKLQRITVEATTDLVELGPCGISMDDFEPGDVAVVLPCKHAYKENLILQWLQTHQTCPSCRTQLPQSP